MELASGIPESVGCKGAIASHIIALSQLSIQNAGGIGGLDTST